MSMMFSAAAGMVVRVVVQFLTLALTLVAARFLGPADFGVFALATIGVTIVRTLLYAGPYEFLLKTPQRDRYATECLVANGILSGGLSGVLLIVAALIAAGGDDGKIVVNILALIPSNLISAYLAWLEVEVLRKGRLSLYYVAMVLSEVLAAAVAVGLLQAGYGLSALVAQVYVRGVVNLLVYLLARLPQGLTRPDRCRLLEVFRWSLASYGNVLLGFASQNTADVLLGVYLSAQATGLYRAASRISTAGGDVISQPLRVIGQTTFARLAAAEKSVSGALVVMVGASAIIGWPALAILAALAAPVVKVALGTEWASAAAIVPYLCGARALALTSGIKGLALINTDRQGRVLQAGVLSSILQISGIVLAAPHGPVAVGISILIVQTLVSASYVVLAVMYFADACWGMIVYLGLNAAAVMVTYGVTILTYQEVTTSGVGGLLALVFAAGAGLLFAALSAALQAPRLIRSIRGSD